MANNEELAILIRAQAITQQAFDKARKDLADLGQQSKNTNSSLGLMKDGLGALGVAFTATAVVGFAKDVLDTAGNIADLSSALGISTDAVQDFKQSAEDSGATIDDVGRAIQKLNDEAASNADGFSKLGLNIDKMLALSPEERFRAVANALKDIQDPAERAARGHDLLGKSYDALAAAIDNGIGSMSDSNKMTKETISTLDELGDGIGHVITSVKNFGGEVIAKAFTDFNHMLSETKQGFLAALDGADKFFAKLGVDLPKERAELAELWETFKLLRDGVTNLPKAPKAPDLFGGQGPSAPKRLTKEELEQIEDGLNKERKALDEASKAVDRHAEAIKKLREELSGDGAIKAAHDMEAALKGVSVAEIEASGNLERVNKTMGVALDVFKAMGQEPPANIRKIYQETFRLTDTIPLIHRWKESFSDVVKDGFLPLHGIAEKLAHETWPANVQGMAEMVRAIESAKKPVQSLGEKIQDSLVNTLKQVPQTIVNAFTGGGGLAGAAKATASMVGSAIGGTIGTSIGGPLGGAIGSALGSLAGPLIGKIGSLLGIGATEYEKRMKAAADETRKLQQQLVSSHGSMAQLIRDADLVGINIKEAFNWKDPEAFKNIVGELDQKTQLLNSAMEEYGFTWEDLGEKARGAKLSQLFDDLFAKTDILRTAGIDYHTILERQADDYSKLVQSAIRTGTEIPAAMEPVLQDLLDMGKLVDENGEAFTDLSQVKWAKTLTEGFDQVTAAIRELTDALVNGVGGALDSLGSKTVRVPIKFDVEGLPEDQLQGFAGGTHGAFVDFGSGRPVMLHGRERVMTEAEGRSSSGWGMGPVIVQIDGREIARASVQYQKSVLSPYGVR